jgi:hypothetical protein
MDQKNLTPPLEVGGPYEGRGSQTPLPSIHSLAHSLAHSMASKDHLMKKIKKIHITQVRPCNHHHQLYNTSAKCGP